MATHRNSQDEQPEPGTEGLDEPSGTPGLWEESDPRIDDWEVASDPEPCAVYRDSPEAMGRITTPLGDLWFTNLYGSRSSMSRQLGRRSAREIRDGALEFLNEFPSEVVQALVPSPLVRAGNWALEQWLVKRLREGLVDEQLKMFRSFADGAGQPLDEIISAQLVWDIWAVLARAPLERVQTATGRARHHSPLLGSFSATLPTNTVGPLHLRWLDNAAVDRWDRNNSVVFFHPDRGMSYVLVASLGFITGLPAGMNAAGLSVSVEPSAREDVDWSGSPLGLAVHEMLAEAHTIEEAATILRERSSMTPWRFVVCEGDTGRTAIFEVDETVERTEATEGPTSVGSWDGALPGHQLARVRRWHVRRRDRMDELLADWTPAGDDAVFDALEAVADGTEPTPVEGPGQPFGGLSNTGAVVFEPANRRLWVAVGRSPVCRRWFVPMSLRPDDGSRDGGLDGRVRPLKPADDWETRSEGRAVEHLRQAHQLAVAGEDPGRVLINLEHALALDARLPSLHVLSGLMALEAGRARRAEGAFRKAMDLLEEPTRRAELSLYLAWALDLQGRPKEARRLYAKVGNDSKAEPAVRRWASAGRRSKFEEGDMGGFEIDFFLATVFEA